MKLQLRGDERKRVISLIREHFRAPVDGKKIQSYVETAVRRHITLGVAQALIREAWREKERTMREDEKESAKALRERRVPAYAGQLELSRCRHQAETSVPEGPVEHSLNLVHIESLGFHLQIESATARYSSEHSLTTYALCPLSLDEELGVRFASMVN